MASFPQVPPEICSIDIFQRMHDVPRQRTQAEGSLKETKHRFVPFANIVPRIRADECDAILSARKPDAAPITLGNKRVPVYCTHYRRHEPLRVILNRKSTGALSRSHPYSCQWPNLFPGWTSAIFPAMNPFRTVSPTRLVSSGNSRESPIAASPALWSPAPFLFRPTGLLEMHWPPVPFVIMFLAINETPPPFCKKRKP